MAVCGHVQLYPKDVLMQIEGCRRLMIATVNKAFADYAEGINIHSSQRVDRKWITVIEHHYEIGEWLLTTGVHWLSLCGYDIDAGKIDKKMFNQYVLAMTKRLYPQPKKKKKSKRKAIKRSESHVTH